MPKEFYDILPPQKALERPEPKIEIPKKPKKRPLPSLSRKIALILLFPLLVLGILSFLNLGRAEIEIVLESELIDLEKKVILGSNLPPDSKEDSIPATIIEDVRTISREFPATGQGSVEKRAEGTIRVYNEYSTNTQAFVEKTRFISAEGKLFRSLERILVPGQKYEAGKLVSGFVDIKVQAVEPGEDYNINPTTFSIPGLLGTNMYTSFYAKSFSAMKGGSEGMVSQVKEDDLKRAKEVLKEELFEKGFLKLQEKCKEQSLTLLENLVSREVLEESCSAKTGDNVDSFTCEAKVRLKALVFKEEDIKRFIKTAILSKVPEGKQIQPGSLELSYFLESKDLEKGQADLDLTSLAAVLPPIDEAFLKKGTAGKSKEEVKIFLETYPGVKKARLKLWPFWLKRVPASPERINIKILFE